ncbi:helix-turn-helix domain-containing protein [Marinitenerispora sediminis]|nr:helix-turn-helix domain-containing protein [Marinitenerispora sediminis]
MIERELSTEHLPPSERFAYWHEVSRQLFLPCALSGEATDDYRMQARFLDFGAMRMAKLALPPSRISRSPKLVRQHDPGVYQLIFSLHGHQSFAQAGRASSCGPRGLLLNDSSRPFHGTMTSGRDQDRTTLVVTQFPRALLPFKPGVLDRLLATRLPGHGGIGALLIHCLTELGHGSTRHTAADAARLSSVAADLIAALFAHTLESGSGLPPETHHRVLLLRVQAYIERNLADPGLTPAAIAAAHHISISHLHRVFKAQGLGVATWIRQRRLQRCRRDLADPALLAYPIHAIAARWGFPSNSHFSRAFRASYGLTPGDYRHAACRSG